MNWTGELLFDILSLFGTQKRGSAFCAMGYSFSIPFFFLLTDRTEHLSLLDPSHALTRAPSEKLWVKISRRGVARLKKDPSVRISFEGAHPSECGFDPPRGHVLDSGPGPVCDGGCTYICACACGLCVVSNGWR